MSDRGFAVIGIDNPKYKVNVSSLVRSARAFGASSVFTVGAQRLSHGDDTPAVGHDKHIPIFQMDSTDELLGVNGTTVAITTDSAATPLRKIHHPERAVYVLGSEDTGHEDEFLAHEDVKTVRIPTQWCLNVATAGSLVLYDRQAKQSEDYDGEGLSWVEGAGDVIGVNSDA